MPKQQQQRQIGSDKSDGRMTDEKTGGYVAVYATLGVEKRRDGSATDRERRLAIIIVETKGWKGKRHYQRNLFHELNHEAYTTGVCFQRIILYKKKINA